MRFFDGAEPWGPSAATVSVVIPTFNCAAYLEEALRSVLAQTHPAREIIVVDDGSTDATASVVASFGAAVTYLPQANAGVAAARNAGMARARGDYIAFLDADDYWAPDKLETQLRLMAACPEVDLVCADFWLDGSAVHASYIRRKYRLFRTYGLDWPSIFATRLTVPGTAVTAWTGNVFASLFLGNFVNTSSVLLRRSAYERAGSFSETLRTQEDYDYWLRIARHAACAFVDRPLLAFRRRGNQLTARGQRLRLAEDVLTVVEATAPSARAVVPPPLMAKRLSERCLAVAIPLLAARKRSQARDLLHRALRHRPFSVKAAGLLLLSFVPLTVSGVVRRGVAATQALTPPRAPLAEPSSTTAVQR